jgi:ubiquinone/menaquinone biosynthesis C-methylase UbiE
LTPEEEKIKKLIFHEFLEWGYTGLLGWIQRQGHIVAEFLSKSRMNVSNRCLRTLEVGCGKGYHFQFVKEFETCQYIGLDIDIDLLRCAHTNYPSIQLVTADASRIPFKSAVFDKIFSIYTFEHLHYLPESLAEVQRVLKPGGELMVGLPAEGVIMYEAGRRLTSKRYFERKYGINYMRLVRSEHCNTCQEVIREIRNYFHIAKIRYLPFWIPSIHLNAIVVLRVINDQPLRNLRKLSSRSFAGMR